MNRVSVTFPWRKDGTGRGTPKGRDAGAKYLREFIEDIKAAGLVAQTIEKNGGRGVSVAPKA